MTNRILVTGGAGFIGSHYVRTLLGAHGPGDLSITVLDKLTYAGNPANLDAVRDSAGLTFEHGDICDAALVDRLAAQHDQIVHFAAETHVDRSITGADPFVQTNAVGTQVLLDAALRHGLNTFVHISTDEVYGSVDHACPETDPLHPSSPYAASKAAADLLVLSYHRTHGLDTRVLRCTNNFGHHQFPEKVIPLFITNLLQGRKVPLYGDGLNVREWLHIDDHVRGIELVRTQGRAGEIYNIGGGTELTNRELTQRLLDACGTGWEAVDFVPDRKGHDRRYSVDFTKIHTELGYRPSKDFDTALAETVAWYRDNRAWWEPLRAHDLAVA
ncbi:dTDP-glucose 4,6-dehydratase [Streptomyces sp. NPDC021080]|uniref:dTDP-glucose 4,6-dehydratase n=1 Tax=Streptomyces sp. NPDC021080 TaxID=3365110 RepID=UPI0037887773